VAATLRDLICFEGQRCNHGHTIDVRLTHQDLAELVGVARPVVSAELVQLRSENLISYTRSYFCVDDLAGLDRVAST
jgi:CRP-like cAMP-binding protein